MYGFAILASGNNYGKVHLLAKFSQLKILSKSSFHRLQKYIYVPEINKFWKEHQESLSKSFLDKKIVVLGEVVNMQW